MTDKKRRPQRVHFTNARHQIVHRVRDAKHPDKVHEVEYDLTYCGQTYAYFSGEYEDCVYCFSILTTKLLDAADVSNCPECMASEYLRMDLLDYERPHELTKIEWHEWYGERDGGVSGHGVNYYHPQRGSPVAWVKGFEWLHCNPDKIIVWCIKPDDICTLEYLSEMKRTIEAHLVNKKVPKGAIGENLFADVNG